MPERERIVAAMSGGVDSSVAAALLLEGGYEVIGITLRVTPCAEDGSEHPDLLQGQRCCTARDVDDARRAAQVLGIPHYVLNVKESFRRDVIDPFIQAYANGVTPVPCAPCNHMVKFGALLEHAWGVGADTVATGHYAKLQHGPAGVRLLKPADVQRDQTYFLHGVSREQLLHVRFPLADMRKEAVRTRAREMRLAVADKPDSQEICFIPDGDTQGFLNRHLGSRPGDIMDFKGRVLGQHQGLHLFTIGQRRGLGLSTGSPLHVIALEPLTNTVVVGPEEELYAPGCLVDRINLISPAWPEDGIEVKIRSRHAGVACVVEPLAEGRARVRFASPQRSVTPGQAAVFYRGDEVLGGGTILAAERYAAAPVSI